ncbi:MAG: hypothetical protein WBE76_27960 [Terracidiphilus sp.]
MTAPSELAQTVEIIKSIATAAGICGAGFWALYNFGLTRASAPQITMDASLKSSTNIGNNTLVIIAMELKNTGRTKVDKRQALLGVRNVAIPKMSIVPARISHPFKYQADVHEILTTHSRLEPSEQYHEELAFLVKSDSLVQIGIVFVGRKKNQTWEANYLFQTAIAEPESMTK